MPWPLPESDDELLKLAKGYPYATPGHSYIYRADAIMPLDGTRGDVFEGRTPVIAHGSNRSPQQLQRKFGDWPVAESEIPVSRAWLRDYDVVYSAHVTRYGAIATNLQKRHGTRVELYVTWLDERQLSRMHETEIGSEIYEYGRLSGIDLALEEGPSSLIDEATTYLSRRGCLAREARPIALAASAGDGRHPVMAQEEVLSYVRDRFRPDRPLDAHILETIRNASSRQELIEEMMTVAVPPHAPHFEKSFS